MSAKPKEAKHKTRFTLTILSGDDPLDDCAEALDHVSKLLLDGAYDGSFATPQYSLVWKTEWLRKSS